MKMSKLENDNNWNKRQGQHINYGDHHLSLKESSSHEVGRE
jgi:hypothetical protein